MNLQIAYSDGLYSEPRGAMLRTVSMGGWAGWLPWVPYNWGFWFLLCWFTSCLIFFSQLLRRRAPSKRFWPPPQQLRGKNNHGWPLRAGEGTVAHLEPLQVTLLERMLVLSDFPIKEISADSDRCVGPIPDANCKEPKATPRDTMELHLFFHTSDHG